MGYATELFIDIKKANLKVDIEKIEEAYVFAKEAHRGQFRKSGDNYIIHPVEVVKILVEMRMDTETIIAGILHDMVEDTLLTIADIEYNFGIEIALLVDGVTKLKSLPQGSQKQAENIRKMIVAMAKDIRVVIIKLADRLHNMRTLKFMKKEKQQSIAKETLDIFAPLAHRIGMAKIKWELEDLALYYLEPQIYREIVEMISAKRAEREKYIENVIKIMENEIEKYNIKDFEITGRPKHFYSIYKKMYEKGKTFEELYDLAAIRATVNTEVECYNILGIIHNLWKPVPGRFKDYIAVPKSNGYQSIHTTVVGPDGQFVEIQIRTYEMHKIAEDGIAAHWKYKEKARGSGKSDNIYSWLKQILEWQKEADTSEEFVKTVTGDILNETVFVFSPKGDVVELIAEATPLDFAFYIHTEIGYKCIGAKVNGSIVPLDYKLKNGDKIEIITSKNAKGPGNNWINMVASHSSKAKIKKWFKEKEFHEKVREGLNSLEKILIKRNYKLKDIEEAEKLEEYLKKHNIPSYEELLFQIGIGKIVPEFLIDKLLEKNIQEKVEIEDFISKKVKKEHKKNDYGIVIEGTDNTVLRFAKCCTPLPGDDVEGYISRGKGIVIHRKDCINFKSLSEKEPGRVLEVSWDENLNKNMMNKYSFTFNVLVIDRVSILIDIVNLISEHKINILAINSITFKKDGKKRANIKITIEISKKSEYERLINSILKLKDVLEINRA